jgi:hypothetical protein
MNDKIKSNKHVTSSENKENKKKEQGNLDAWNYLCEQRSLIEFSKREEKREQ